LRNLGAGLFADPVNLTVAQGPVALTSADLNADGFPDLLAASAPPGPPGILTSYLATGPSPCIGDTNGDQAVDFTDLSNLLAVYGQFVESAGADFNDDGLVNFTDLNMLLQNFGAICP